MKFTESMLNGYSQPLGATEDQQCKNAIRMVSDALKRLGFTDDGKEIALKGCTFLTEEGPHNLTKALIQEGYGHTKEVLGELKKREDFKDAVEHLNDDEDFGEGEYFDMRSILLTAADESEEIEEDAV
jgi:hypothetical protein